MQPATVSFAGNDIARPLVVALHSWSFDHSRHYEEYMRLCADYGWNCIFPKFRGPNWTPEALGSEFTIADILAAVEYMKREANIAPDRIFLVGGSGGGHAALLFAARLDDVFAAASAGCPITDIAAWHRQKKFQYWEHIEKACGGDPQTDSEAMKQATRRSPLTWLKQARHIPIDIQTGIHDGHKDQSVPISHSLYAFNVLADDADRISETDIAHMTETEEIPRHLQADFNDPSFGATGIHFQRTSRNARITVLEGGHMMNVSASFSWFSAQRKGQNAVWESNPASEGKSAPITQ